MKKLVAVTLVTACIGAPAFAQSSTATGTGVAVSRSSSASGAVAIGGGNATGGNAAGGNAAGGTGGTSAATSSLTLNSSVPSTQTINSVASGEQTLRNVPTVFSPGLAAAGLETCLGSASVGVGWIGAGLSGGSTYPDVGCQARLDARTLWSFGLKKAAVARLCQRDDIYRSMPEICSQYSPQTAPVGYGAPVGYPVVGYAGGPILLIEGKSGQERLCNDYDETRQRCRVWAYAVTHHAVSSKTVLKVGALHIPAAKPSAAAAAKSAAPAETTEGKSE
jgi:hypothetical protein